MLAAVGPRPIAFVSTIDKEGRPNLAPFSFFNAFGSRPPILVFSPARRGRENTTKHTLENVEEVPECVINMVSYSMAEQMNLASTEFGKGENEFVRAGFTELPSLLVQAPRVKEAPASFECKVLEVKKTGDLGGAGNLVICEVLALHFDESLVLESGKIDITAMDLIGRMGYEYYCRASGEALFELPKPKTNDVIGFDGLPREIRESEYFTGQELARLANCVGVPEPDAEFAIQIMQGAANPDYKILISKAKEFIHEHEVESAWKILQYAISLNK
jgi:flavin reductase (DIM6/NTAB) family NADH-FMN oxidoreductase RutF